MRQKFNRVVDLFMRVLGTPTALALAALTIYWRNINLKRSRIARSSN